MPKYDDHSPGGSRSKCVEAGGAQQGRIKTHGNSCSVFPSHSSSLRHFVFPHLASLAFIIQALVLLPFSSLMRTHSGFVYIKERASRQKGDMFDVAAWKHLSSTQSDCTLRRILKKPKCILFSKSLRLDSANIFTSFLWIYPLWLTATGNTCPQLTHAVSLRAKYSHTRCLLYQGLLTIFSHTSSSAPRMEMLAVESLCYPNTLFRLLNNRYLLTLRHTPPSTKYTHAQI